MTSPSGNRDQPDEKLQPHIIMRGTLDQRDALVKRLKEKGLDVEPYPHPPAMQLPKFHRFNRDIPKKSVKGETFDAIESPYALYTFDPVQLGLKSDASCEEQDERLKVLIQKVKQEPSPLEVDVHRDWMITGIETVISGTSVGDANEGPGISPSGWARWLEPEISSALSRKPAPMDGGADTAIVILDTAPDDLHLWDSQDHLVDGYADFTPLLVHDKCRSKWFDKALRTSEMRVRMAITEKMDEDRRKGVENHGLMVAALCRDNAPKDTRLILLRVQDNNGIGTVYALCNAMYYAFHLREQHVFPPKLIFNLSLGLPASDHTGIDSHCLLEAIAHAVNQPDTFVVCAAGDINPSSAVKQRVDAGGTNPSSTVKQRVDEGGTNPSSTAEQRVDAEEPAAYYRIESELKATRRDDQLMTEEEIQCERERYDIRPERFEQRLLCVGATDQSCYTDEASISYAPFSKKADLAAPGMDLLLRTREPGEFGKPGRDSYLIWSGASFAAPQVSGLVACMLTGKDENAADLVHEVLKGTGKPIKDPAAPLPEVLGDKDPPVQPPAADVPPQIDPNRALAELERRMDHKSVSSLSGQGEQNGTQNNGAQGTAYQAADGLAHTLGEEQTSM